MRTLWPSFVITEYGPIRSWTPERGAEVTYSCNAQHPESGKACSLPVGHEDPRHSWERPMETRLLG